MSDQRSSKTIAIPERELWSLVRSILEQGRDIQVDYAHGVYSSYEHCSARVDEAARERADKLLQKYGTADETSACALGAATHYEMTKNGRKCPGCKGK